ncbi:hypothetical protein N7478_005972 [Penicillium angulare]|uniref:uncharacterized protein n=1 Tax=Penicillium angulare TaxID=116970 RepID=UPI002540F499|nr:uncharacterized protein N7478_005972 [Penicillium angulare]KAJ5280600.1 hypothetical protein N7478_005972 [Penicillium angulare]
MTIVGALGYQLAIGLWYLLICLALAFLIFLFITNTFYSFSSFLAEKSQSCGVDLFEILETILYQTEWISHWPLTLTNTIAKQTTSEEDRQKQLEFLTDKENIIFTLRELQQREIYLIEHGDRSTEASALYQASADRRHSLNTQEKRKSVLLEGRELWLKFKGLPSRQPSGAWIREDLRKSKRAQHHRDEYLCQGVVLLIVDVV